MARPAGILDGDQPNLLWFTFADARARTVYPDWNDIADEQVANLRAELGRPDDDARALATRLGLAAGVDFAARWKRRAVARTRTGVKALEHPEVGLLRLAFETLELPDPDRQRLVVYLPADAATAAVLNASPSAHPADSARSAPVSRSPSELRHRCTMRARCSRWSFR